MVRNLAIFSGFKVPHIWGILHLATHQACGNKAVLVQYSYPHWVDQTCTVTAKDTGANDRLFMNRMEFLVTFNGREGLSYPIVFVSEFVYCF